VTCDRFSPGTHISSINKTDRHEITEILLKVALNTINQPYFTTYVVGQSDDSICKTILPVNISDTAVYVRNKTDVLYLVLFRSVKY